MRNAIYFSMHLTWTIYRRRAVLPMVKKWNVYFLQYRITYHSAPSFHFSHCNSLTGILRLFSMGTRLSSQFQWLYIDGYRTRGESILSPTKTTKHYQDDSYLATVISTFACSITYRMVTLTCRAYLGMLAREHSYDGVCVGTIEGFLATNSKFCRYQTSKNRVNSMYIVLWNFCSCSLFYRYIATSVKVFVAVGL